MKRIIRVVIICAFLLTSFGVVPGLADPAGPWPIFIPMLARSPAHFTVSGTVRDSNNYTVAGATIMDKNGLSTVTDIQGNYSLSVDQGPNTLSATRNGYAMAPLSINVASNLAGVNFNAQVGCGNIVTNEQVNVGMGGWSFLSDHAGDVDPLAAELLVVPVSKTRRNPLVRAIIAIALLAIVLERVFEAKALFMSGDHQSPVRF